MRFAPGSIVGQYRICELLGSGAAGRVFAVEHLMTGRKEAMKVMLHGEPDSPEAQRFLREAQLQARLDHPNIVKVHNAFREDGNLVIVMEMIEGESLEARLSKGRLTQSEALDITRQALSALDYAHARGVTHRDIKPSNMLIAPGGELKLTDFGLAKTATDAKLTQTGVLLGSPYYMSPEQVKTEPVIDARSDIYSLGVVLYEMAAGRRPFEDPTPFALMLSHLERTPHPPRELDASVPAALSRAIQRALMKEPGERFQSAGEFRQAIEAAAVTRGRWAWKRPASVAAAAAILITIGLIPWKRPPQPSPPAKTPKVVSSARSGRPSAKKLVTAEPPLQSIRPSGMVWAVDLSPDGRLLAAGGESRAVEIWETDTGRKTAVLRGHESGVTAVAFSPDGGSLITGDGDGTTKLWDVATKSARGDFGQSGFINDAAISGDGQWLASASADKRVRVWNLKDTGQIYDLKGFKREPSTVSFSPNGAILAAISTDNVLRLWNLSGGRALPREPVVDRNVNVAAFSPDGQRMAIAGVGRVRVFDMAHRDQIGAIDVPGSRQALVFTPDGRCLAADTVAGAVTVWDVYRAEEIARHPASGRLRALAFSRDGLRLAIAPEGGPIAIRSQTLP